MKVNYFLKVISISLFLSVFTFVYAQNTLEVIEYSSMPGDKVQIEMRFNGAVPDPELFTIDTPARIVLDFQDIDLSSENRKKNINIGSVRNIKAVKAGNRVRVVTNLTTLTDYQLKKSNNSLYLILNSASQGRIEQGEMPLVENIDFRRGSEGEGNIIIKFNQDDIENINIKDEGEKILVTMTNVNLPADLERRLNVIDFATPVQLIDTYQQDDNIKMVIESKGEYDHLGYQMGNQFTIEIKALSEKEKEQKNKERFGYSGERLSLIFQDIEVRAVLQLIADFTGKNMVTSDSVGGNITLRLKNVPWDQALDLILKTKGLAMREEGNVIRVAPMEEIASIEKQELEANKQIAQLLPRVRETIQLNYRRASVVVELLKSIGAEEGAKNSADSGMGNAADAGADDTGASLISSNATLIGDDRTNKIIVYDNRRNIEQLRKLIEEIDVPTKQVLIDSRIVSATDGFTREIGVNWSTFNRNDIHLPTGIYTGNEAAVNLSKYGSSALSGAGSTLGISSAVLGGGWLVDLELHAAESDSKVEIVSSPRVVSANGEKATIKQGVEIPFQTVEDGEVSLTFKEVVLKLEVTPNITPNNRIDMEIAINNDNEDGLADNGALRISKQELKTNVIANNGDTVVLGGVYKNVSTKSQSKIPLLGDLPVIGHIFSNSSKDNEKRELLIFLTPKVLNSEISLNRR